MRGNVCRNAFFLLKPKVVEKDAFICQPQYLPRCRGRSPVWPQLTEAQLKMGAFASVNHHNVNPYTDGKWGVFKGWEILKLYLRSIFSGLLPHTYIYITVLTCLPYLQLWNYLQPPLVSRHGVTIIIKFTISVRLIVSICLYQLYVEHQPYFWNLNDVTVYYKHKFY